MARRTSMKARLAVIAASISWLITIGPAFAHHGGNPYDREHPVTLSGSVTEYRYANPHVQIIFAVKDGNGNVQSWIAECPPPQRLFRAGWSKDTLKPGDQITVTGSPARNGKHVM